MRGQGGGGGEVWARAVGGASFCQSATETGIPCFWLVHHICILLVPSWEGLQIINDVLVRAPTIPRFSCATCRAQTANKNTNKKIEEIKEMHGREKANVLRNAKTKAAGERERMERWYEEVPFFCVFYVLFFLFSVALLQSGTILLLVSLLSWRIPL